MEASRWPRAGSPAWATAQNPGGEDGAEAARGGTVRPEPLLPPNLLAVRVTIPESHPRYASLVAREALVEGVEAGYVARQGLIAHGRGEAFDYLMGEATPPPARDQIRAGAAAFRVAEHPVISVNGNVAALCPGRVALLQEATGAKVEVNLFHRTQQRVEQIVDRLRAHGCRDVLGADPEARIEGLEGDRARVAGGGIKRADCVLVPLEDGDRTEALVGEGKRVVAIDLNPLSRTSRRASVTVVDEVSRALAAMAGAFEELASKDEARGVLKAFSNEASRRESLAFIGERLQRLADKDE